MKNIKVKIILEQIVAYSIVVVLLLGYKYFCTDILYIAKTPTASMSPIIPSNGTSVGFKHYYDFFTPNRFDVVDFADPDGSDKIMQKRIIGMPGEKLEIKDGRVYINDELLEEPLQFIEEPEGNYGPYNIPEDSYFMMGDNRNISKDARYWNNKYVSKDDLICRELITIKPSIKIL